MKHLNNKLGVSSQTNLVNKCQWQCQCLILYPNKCLNHNSGSELCFLIQKRFLYMLQQWWGRSSLDFNSSHEPISSRNHPDNNSPDATVLREGLNPLEVPGLQPAGFVEVCCISVSPVELEHTPSAIVSKSGQIISTCVSISFSTTCFLHKGPRRQSTNLSATIGDLVLTVKSHSGRLKQHKVVWN